MTNKEIILDYYKGLIFTKNDQEAIKIANDKIKQAKMNLDLFKVTQKPEWLTKEEWEKVQEKIKSEVNKEKILQERITILEEFINNTTSSSSIMPQITQEFNRVIVTEEGQKENETIKELINKLEKLNDELKSYPRDGESDFDYYNRKKTANMSYASQASYYANMNKPGGLADYYLNKASGSFYNDLAKARSIKKEIEKINNELGFDYIQTKESAENTLSYIRTLTIPNVIPTELLLSESEKEKRISQFKKKKKITIIATSIIIFFVLVYIVYNIILPILKN